MSDKKIIIRNCPACRQYQVGVYTCDELYDCDLQRCQDCTGCKLKQIVELCKPLNTKQPESYYNLEVLLAKRILKLLDIQEVE